MTTDRNRITEIVYSSIDELNRELGKNQRLEKSLTTPLSGEGSSGLDSLAIVSFQMILEEKFGDALDVDALLDFEQFVGSAEGESRTVGSLIDHLLTLMDRGTAGH